MCGKDPINSLPVAYFNAQRGTVNKTFMETLYFMFEKISFLFFCQLYDTKKAVS